MHLRIGGFAERTTVSDADMMRMRGDNVHSGKQLSLTSRHHHITIISTTDAVYFASYSASAPLQPQTRNSSLISIQVEEIDVLRSFFNGNWKAQRDKYKWLSGYE